MTEAPLKFHGVPIEFETNFDGVGVGASLLGTMSRMTVAATHPWWTAQPAQQEHLDAPSIEEAMGKAWRACITGGGEPKRVFFLDPWVYEAYARATRRGEQIEKRGYYIRRWHAKAPKNRRLNWRGRV